MYIYIFLSRDVGSMSKTESVIPPYTFHFRETTRCKALPRDLKSAYASALGCSEPCMAGHLCLKSLVGPIGQPSSTIICRQRILCLFSIFPGAAVSRMQSFRGCICAYMYTVMLVVRFHVVFVYPPSFLTHHVLLILGPPDVRQLYMIAFDALCIFRSYVLLSLVRYKYISPLLILGSILFCCEESGNLDIH